MNLSVVHKLLRNIEKDIAESFDSFRRTFEGHYHVDFIYVPEDLIKNRYKELSSDDKYLKDVLSVIGKLNYLGKNINVFYKYRNDKENINPRVVVFDRVYLPEFLLTIYKSKREVESMKVISKGKIYLNSLHFYWEFVENNERYELRVKLNDVQIYSMGLDYEVFYAMDISLEEIKDLLVEEANNFLKKIKF